MASIYQRKRNARKPWAVRYRDADGKQREQSFTLKREAADFLAKLDYESRAGIFTDPKRASLPFIEYAAQIVGGMAVSDGTRRIYRSVLRTWIAPWAGTRTLRQVAEDREGVADLINSRMHDATGELLSFHRRASARTIILATVAEAVAAGRLTAHKLSGIKLIRDSRMTERKDFVFPTYAQVSGLADALDGYGLVVWLMRGCGLRIREALAVHREDFSGTLATSTLILTLNRRKDSGTNRQPKQCGFFARFADVQVKDWLPKGTVGEWSNELV